MAYNMLYPPSVGRAIWSRHFLEVDMYGDADEDAVVGAALDMHVDTGAARDMYVDDDVDVCMYADDHV